MSKKKDKEEMFLQGCLHGYESMTPEELRETLLKRYGKEVVETRSETKSAKGMWNSLKRSLGIGGYKTEEIPVTFAEKIKDMDGDDLEDFWHEDAKRRLDSIINERLAKIGKVLHGFSGTGIHELCWDEKHERMDGSAMAKLWQDSVDLCEDVGIKHFPEKQNLYHFLMDSGFRGRYSDDHVVMNLADMIRLQQICDEEEIRALTGFFQDPLCANSNGGGQMNVQILRGHLLKASEEKAAEFPYEYSYESDHNLNDETDLDRQDEPEVSKESVKVGSVKKTSQNMSKVLLQHGGENIRGQQVPSGRKTKTLTARPRGSVYGE